MLNKGARSFQNKNLGATSKFYAPGGWREASCMLRTHTYYISPWKLIAMATWRPDLCIPPLAVPYPEYLHRISPKSDKKSEK